MTKKQKLSTQPYKGARDFYPKDMQVRNWLFGIWEKTARLYGYEEYDFPLIEPWELYAAKSGKELVDKQLYWFEDRGGRKVAIRPEKTPSVARMIAAKLNELPRPIRWFNIGNCWRYERPQRGRGREFYQFDCDILGESSVSADAEVFSIPVEIMLELGATEKMFEIRVSNRNLTETYLKEIVKLEGSISESGSQMYKVAKAVDSKPKISEKDFEEMLTEAAVNANQVDQIIEFISADLSFIETIKDINEGATELLDFFAIIEKKGYKKYFKFYPEIMRGFDYYTGNVIEMFDLNKKNNRSIFGGGRYDNLVGLFSDTPLSGVGFAMGDYTFLEFLNNWDLLPTLPPEAKAYVTIFDENTQEKSFEIAKALRSSGIKTVCELETGKKLDKQLKYADKKKIPFVIIVGPEEIKKNVVTLRDMKAKRQEQIPIDAIVSRLS